MDFGPPQLQPTVTVPPAAAAAADGLPLRVMWEGREERDCEGDW
jgi:hypothetical protein